jgi:hypothetical protein
MNDKLRVPPSLSSVQTDLDRLYVEADGPAQIDSGLHRPSFEGAPEEIKRKLDKPFFKRACDEFGRKTLEPILSNFCNDRVATYRHWPWAAVAAHRYATERKPRKAGRQLAEPSPKKVEAMLDNIGASATSLHKAMSAFIALSEGLHDPSSPWRRGHVAFIDQQLEEAAAGFSAGRAHDEDDDLALSFIGRQEFLKRVEAVRVAAQKGKRQLVRKLLKRSKGQPQDLALHELVRLGALIWTSMTNRRPTAEKVESRKRETCDPDFVLFVRDLAKIAANVSPTRKQISTALKPRVTP